MLQLIAKYDITESLSLPKPNILLFVITATQVDINLLEGAFASIHMTPYFYAQTKRTTYKKYIMMLAESNKYSKINSRFDAIGFMREIFAKQAVTLRTEEELKKVIDEFEQKDALGIDTLTINIKIHAVSLQTSTPFANAQQSLSSSLSTKDETDILKIDITGFFNKYLEENKKALITDDRVYLVAPKYSLSTLSEISNIWDALRGVGIISRKFTITSDSNPITNILVFESQLGRSKESSNQSNNVTMLRELPVTTLSSKELIDKFAINPHKLCIAVDQYKRKINIGEKKSAGLSMLSLQTESSSLPNSNFHGLLFQD